MTITTFAGVMVPVLPEKNRKAWPKAEKGGRVPYVKLGAMLTTRYTSDAHFAAYSLPSVERRLDVSLIRDPANADKIPAGVPMVLVTFDVDCEQSHKASGARTPLPAPDEWWLAELPKIGALLAAHPGGFVYRTRGGYRLVYILDAPIVLRGAADDERWTTTYVRWIAYLQRAFGIFADPSCSEWVRLFRTPHATREGEARPEERETMGDASAVGPWRCEPSAEDIALALTLKKQKAPKGRRETRRNVAPATAGDGVLFHAFKARGELGEQIEPGKWAVRCPWHDRHSKGAALDTSTILYAPDLAGGETVGWLHCSHAHCQALTLGDVCAHFSEQEIADARIAAGLTEEQISAPALQLLNDASFRPRKCVANIMTVLSCAPDCAGLLSYDEFREAVVVSKAPPCRPSDRPPSRETNEWCEEDSTRFAAWLLETHDLEVTSGMVEEAVKASARRHTVNPVRDWLDSIESKWDGTKRVERLFIDYFGAADTPYSRGISVCWMVSGAARAHQPGCQADYLVVLEGLQGTGKTTGLEALAGQEWFSDTGLDITSKDGCQCLRGKWIYLFDELDGIAGRAAVTRVKNFLSRRVDNIRPSFGRRNRDFLRRCIFAATTNEWEYLQDATGNRRFWPERCGVVKVDAIRRDREQLWAEAMVLYRAGTHWWPSRELEKLCQVEQADRVQRDPWLDIIEEWLQKPVQPSLDASGRPCRDPFDVSHGLLTSEVLMYALGKRPGDISKPDEMRVAAALRALKYERGEQRREDGERVRRFVRRVTSPKGGDEVVTPGGDTPDTGKKATHRYPSPVSPPNGYSATRAGTREGFCLDPDPAPPANVISGGDGGDGDSEHDALERAAIESTEAAE